MTSFRFARRAGPVLALALFLVGAAGVHAADLAPATPVRGVGVLIYLYGADEITPAKAEYLFAKFTRALSADPSITATHLFRARDAAELRAALDAAPFAPDVRITKLLISAHGTSQTTFADGDPHRYLEVTFGDLAVHARNREDQDVAADSGRHLEMSLSAAFATFATLRAAMAETADVFCTGCRLVAGTETEAKLKAHALARLFGLRHGRLFANRTDGNLDKLHYRGFWQHDTFGSKLSASSVQLAVGVTPVLGFAYTAAAFVVPPLAMLIEYGYSRVRNQGYAFTFDHQQLTAMERETASGFGATFFGRSPCAPLLAYARGYVGW